MRPRRKGRDTHGEVSEHVQQRHLTLDVGVNVREWVLQGIPETAI